jgi:hypothetical protein
VEVNTVLFGGFLGSIFCLFFLPSIGGNILRLCRRPCGGQHCSMWRILYFSSIFCLFFILPSIGGNIPRLGRRPCGGQHCSIWRISWLSILIYAIHCIGGNIPRLGRRPCGGQHSSIWRIPLLYILLIYFTLYRWKYSEAGSAPLWRSTLFYLADSLVPCSPSSSSSPVLSSVASVTGRVLSSRL